jgi:histidine decarboxylase
MYMLTTPHPARSTLSHRLQETLFETERRIRRANATHLGYPYNLNVTPGVPPSLGAYLINNLGDPYAGSHYAAEVCELECEAIAWLSQVWGGADADLYAGSVGASGTEGNIWGIYLGREAFPDAVLIHGADAHYSIPKAARLQRIETREVRSTPAGEMDLAHLAEVVSHQNGRPVILVLTCGTTMKGAHDDILGAICVLNAAGIDPDQRYIHVDGALNAMVVPFMPAAPRAIMPDFRMGIDSISTSGHKMIGTPMPCGVLICRRTHLERISQAIAYLRSDDTTLMGSRNGHAVLAIWTRLMAHGVAGFAADALRCTLRAAEMATKLRAAGVDVLLNPHAMTVVFPEPSEEILRTYQLPCYKGLAHAIIMPSVTDSLIDRFTAAYIAWFQTAGQPF